MQWRIQGKGRDAPLLFLDQTEAGRAEKKFFGDRPPPSYLRVWMTAPPPYLKVWTCHFPATFIGNTRKLGHYDFLEVPFPAY